ncbi:MAG TPA: hypothetical protein VL588_11545 [Bdellovibrionota bacterium]|nr:hypothetical protein [Bdellovibrionota bacterium]
MRALIIADPIAGLKADFDTGLALAREALRRGHSVDWCEPTDLLLSGTRIHCRGWGLKPFAPLTLPEPQWEFSGRPLSEYDTVWVRKDPPFDMDYLSLCWLLCLEERSTYFLNRPSLLARYHEKMLPLEAVRQGFLEEDEVVPSWMPAGERLLPKPEDPSGAWITKPWLGHGGRGVRKWESLEQALTQIPAGEKSMTLYQHYLEDLTRFGDRRIFFLNGRILGHFCRFPAPGSVKANIAAGGTARFVPMTEKQAGVAGKVCRFLDHLGIEFAGIDMIGQRISEINVTATTGFELLKRLRAEAQTKGLDTGEGLGPMEPPDTLYLKFVEGKLGSPHR